MTAPAEPPAAPGEPFSPEQWQAMAAMSDPAAELPPEPEANGVIGGRQRDGSYSFRQGRLSEAEREELRALRKEVEMLRVRGGARELWRPGVTLREGAPVDLADLQQDYQFEVDKEARKQAAWRDARRAVEAESFKPGTATEYPGTLADSLRRERPAQRFLIESLWNATGNLSIEALFKVGKTALACSAAGSLADGRAFLGFRDVHPPAGRVAMWNLEMDPDEFDDYLTPHVTDHSRIAVAHLRGHPMPVLTSQAARDEAVGWLRQHGASAWLIDSWTRLCAWCGIDPADNFGVARLTAAIDEIKAEAGVPALAVTGHMPHAARTDRAFERGIGAQAFSAWVDSMWRYTRDESGQRFLSAEGRRVRLDECQVWMDGSGRLVAFAGDREDAAGSKEAVSAATTELVVIMTVRETPGLSTAQITRAVGRRKTDVLGVLAKLLAAGQVYTKPGAREATLWFPVGGSGES
jgi:hypothetical protein